MILFCIIVNKQGCVRIKRNYQHGNDREMLQRETEVIAKCLARSSKQCTFFYHENITIVYKTFTALCLICGITKDENELSVQELLNVFMESLVLYFGQVSELDIVFNMERVYMILDEIILNGTVGFTSKERALLPLQLLDAGS